MTGNSPTRKRRRNDLNATQASVPSTQDSSQLLRKLDADDSEIAGEILDHVKKMSLGERFTLQKKIRVKYGVLINNIKKAGDRVTMGEQSNGISDDKIIKMLDETSEELQSISSGKEVSSDAKYMVENVILMRERVRNLQNDQADQRLNITHYAESIIPFTKKMEAEVPKLENRNVNPLLVLDDDEKDDEQFAFKERATTSMISRRQWAALGRHYELVSNVTGISYIRPLLTNKDLQPTVAKAKKDKKDQQTQRQKKGPAVILEQKEKGENMGEDQSVATELDFIWRAFHRHLRKTNSDHCGYYEFTFDPDDFGRTVENMFHVSFLLRDARMRLMKDHQGLPVLVPVTKEEQEKIEDQVKRRSRPNRQTVFAFTQDHWKGLKARLPIHRAVIKPLDKRQKTD